MINRPTSNVARRTLLIVLVLTAALVAGCGSTGSSSTTTTSSSASTLAPTHGKYSPSIDPADFVATVDNPYWPLKPGTGFHFKGVRGTTPQRDDEIVTDRTKTIEGIASTVVRDTVYVDARLGFDDLEAAEASLARLAALPVRRVHAGHDRSFEGGELDALLDGLLHGGLAELRSP